MNEYHIIVNRVSRVAEVTLEADSIQEAMDRALKLAKEGRLGFRHSNYKFLAQVYNVKGEINGTNLRELPD